LPVPTSAFSAARREKNPVPFASSRGINRKTGWGRGTGSRRDTELAEWEGNRWLLVLSFAFLRHYGNRGCLCVVGVRRGHNRDAVGIRVWHGTQGCPRASLLGWGPAPEARQMIGPGVSPGSPIPPRPEPQRGDSIQPPLLRCPLGEEAGSCRLPFLSSWVLCGEPAPGFGEIMVSREDAKTRRMRQARLFACATVRDPDPRANFEIRPSSSRPSRLRVRQDPDWKEPHAKTRRREG
jgi:hypothetical protein